MYLHDFHPSRSIYPSLLGMEFFTLRTSTQRVHTTGPVPYVVFVAERNDELDVYAWLSAIIDENDDPEGFLLDMTRVGATAAGASEAVTALMRRWLRSAGAA